MALEQEEEGKATYSADTELDGLLVVVLEGRLDSLCLHTTRDVLDKLGTRESSGSENSSEDVVVRDASVVGPGSLV